MLIKILTCVYRQLLDITALVWWKWTNSGYNSDVDVFCCWRNHCLRIDTIDGSDAGLHSLDEYSMVYPRCIRLCPLYIQGMKYNRWTLWIQGCYKSQNLYNSNIFLILITTFVGQIRSSSNTAKCKCSFRNSKCKR